MRVLRAHLMRVLRASIPSKHCALNSRGGKKTKKINFKYRIQLLFTTRWCVRGTLCFVLRAGRWPGGNPGLPLAGRSALQLSSSRSASIIDLKGKRGGSRREESKRFWEERQTLPGRKWCLLAARLGGPFVTERGHNARQFAATVIQKHKREREREKEWDLTLVAKPGLLPPAAALFCCRFCSRRVCHQVRLPFFWWGLRHVWLLQGTRAEIHTRLIKCCLG